MIRKLLSLLFTLCCICQRVSSFCQPTTLTTKVFGSVKLNGNIGGQKCDNFDKLDGKILGPANIFRHVGDYHQPREEVPDNSEYNLNLGKALDTLRRELPMVFYTSNLDFSIFASHITVVDGYQNKMSIAKSIYSAAIKSMRVASAISSIYPSLNVKKIEYIDEFRTIQCLVDVVLPDSVRIDGQAVWEGMFFFGVDKHGFIDTHIFDRKISNFTPAPLKAYTYPWVQAAPSWSPDMLKGGFLKPVPVPQPSFATTNTATATAAAVSTVVDRIQASSSAASPVSNE